MDIFSSLFNYITDGTKKLSIRSATTIASIIILLFLDNVIGFSYYYNIDKKLSIVTQINTVLKDTSLQKGNKTYLVQLRNEIINHKSVKDKMWDFLKNSNFQTNHTLTSSGIYYLLNIISATSFPIFITIIVVFVTVPMLLKKKGTFFDDTNSTIILKILGITALLYFVGILEVRVLLSIPLIFGNLIYNYCLNIAVNFLLLFLFHISINKFNKHKVAKKSKPV